MNNASMPAEITAKLKQTAAFVADLIVCRSQTQIYPDSHPAVAAALNRAIVRLAPLLADGKPLTLGITRQGLLLRENLLEPNNVKFREYAALLSSLGVIAVTFTDTVQPEDLISFNRIINCPKNEIWESGGIIHAFDISGIRSILVQAIDFSIFTLTDRIDPGQDDETSDTWGVFVKKLLQGCFSSTPDKIRELLSAPPAQVAGELATMLEGVPEDARQYTLKALADCYVGQSHRKDSNIISDDSLDKVTAFIVGLDPKVRCDFILNICNSAHSTTNFSERLLHKLPDDGLQEVVQAVALQGSNASDMMMSLLQRLASHSEAPLDVDASLSKAGVGSKVQTLMRETDLEQFVPARYLQTLTAILATDKLPDDEYALLQELRVTLEPDRQESKVTDIIDEIVMVIPPAELGEGIRNNLLSQIDYFLDKRDFASLAKVCRILGSGKSGDGNTFFNSDFVLQVLEATQHLGRDRYPEIRDVITAVGAPFIEPLIEKLASEENRSLRRFWFDCLGGLGDMVRNAALSRLNDEQWFVIRNLLVILRDFNDPEVVREVRKLIVHKHPKVRSEALKNLLHYQDPAADKLIQSELQQSDPARKLAAIQIAEMSRNKDIMQELFSMLDNTGIADYQFDIKSAVVQTLANIGNPLALPVLLKIISTTPLLHRSKHAQLKIEAVRALPRFRPDYVRPILVKISGMPGDPLAVHATEALKVLDGAMP